MWGGLKEMFKTKQSKYDQKGNTNFQKYLNKQY